MVSAIFANLQPEDFEYCCDHCCLQLHLKVVCSHATSQAMHARPSNLAWVFC